MTQTWAERMSKKERKREREKENLFVSFRLWLCSCLYDTVLTQLEKQKRGRNRDLERKKDLACVTQNLPAGTENKGEKLKIEERHTDRERTKEVDTEREREKEKEKEKERERANSANTLSSPG